MLVSSDQKMMLLLLLLVHQTSAIIHHLNLTEYSKMPDLFQMDDYDACIAETGGTYCAFDAVLSSRDNSELMQMILEYSENKVKHYNHTQVHRALCVTTTCKEFIRNRSLEREADLRSVLEECVDDAMWKGYKLNARLTELNYCKKHGEKLAFETGDYVVAGVYIVLIILNAVGTLYDVINGDAKGNPYLQAFSLRKNFARLVAPGGEGPEPRLRRLKVFYGLRTLTLIGVFFAHVMLFANLGYLKNPHFIELLTKAFDTVSLPTLMRKMERAGIRGTALSLLGDYLQGRTQRIRIDDFIRQEAKFYDDPGSYLLFNGLIVTNTFLVMSEFLLAFNMELYAEKHRVTLWDWPKGMVTRWLRLTPTYALVMFTVMTLMRHLGDGPQWELVVASEVRDCSRYWWAHLTYVNNYFFEESQCLLQTWYLAADTQLYGLGLFVCILFRKPRAQMLALAVIHIVSLAIPAAHVYFQDLEPVFNQTPETVRTVYKHNLNAILFVRGHTNMSTCTLGIAGGLLVYHWLKNEKSVSERMQKYRWIVWLSLLIGLGIVWSGCIFYIDNYEPSTILKTLYASVHKPIFQLCVVFGIIGCIFKTESVFRGILEWSGFTWTGRVSYAAFLLHTLFQRGMFGSQRLPAYVSHFNTMTIVAATIVFSFGAGALLFVMVESPVAALTKTMLAPRKEQEPIAEDITIKEEITKF